MTGIHILGEFCTLSYFHEEVMWIFFQDISEGRICRYYNTIGAPYPCYVRTIHAI